MRGSDPAAPGPDARRDASRRLACHTGGLTYRSLRPGPIGIALGLCVLACSPIGVAPPSADSTRVSILAVGDTGKLADTFDVIDQQRAVARLMEREDARDPIDAIVLLGDNFYPHGLEREGLVDRIRRSVVAPYCRFVRLDGPRSAEVADACEHSSDRRHPVPIYVVLGNHDYASEESPRLQQELVPQFVSNWHLPQAVAAAFELPGGITLILSDSDRIEHRTDPGPLFDALGGSQGPWRIVASHFPLLERSLYADTLRRAIAETGLTVDVHLGGHEHNLQLYAPPPGSPTLGVISGSGSDVRPNRYVVPGRDLWFERAGLARIDLVRDGETERLEVSLVSVPWHAFLTGRSERLATRRVVRPTSYGSR